MKIVFLMTRLSGYFFNCIKTLVEQYPDVEVKIVAYPKASNAPFSFEKHPSIEIIVKSDVNSIADIYKVLKIDEKIPDIVYLAGWRDSLYRKVARKLKGSAIVLGMDNQWKNTPKQRFLTLVSTWTIKKLADYIMVPGVRQYEYARRLSFDRKKIIKDLYSADTHYFWQIFEEKQARTKTAQKQVVFIGNMWKDKGVEELVNAFKKLSEKYNNWTLTLIGGGPLTEWANDQSDKINAVGFVQPHQLRQYLVDSTVFCLPSYHDAWAVVLHEAACIGIPIVATEVCGAVEAFVKDGYNGFVCQAESELSLSSALEKAMTLSDEKLEVYGQRSFELSKQITSELWASNLIQLIK